MNIDWMIHQNRAQDYPSCRPRTIQILYYLGKFNSPAAKERVLRWLEEAKEVFPADLEYLEDTIRRVKLHEPTDMDSNDLGFDRYRRSELLKLYKDLIGLKGIGCRTLDTFIQNLRNALD